MPSWTASRRHLAIIARSGAVGRSIVSVDGDRRAAEPRQSGTAAVKTLKMTCPD
jgi:hypothetical protein